MPDSRRELGFVVGENFGPHEYTRIHRVSCSHARDGGRRTGNTQWYPLDGGTYPTYADAYAAADACGQPRGPYECSYCQPC